MTKSYDTLNDASTELGEEGLARGGTKIWYWKTEVAADYQRGYNWLRDEGIPVPDAKTLLATHVKVGAIRERDPRRVLELMRSWAPSGKSDRLIEKLGLSHIQMATGDIMHLSDGTLLMVDRGRFVELASRRANKCRSVKAPELKISKATPPPPGRSIASLRRSLLGT